SPKNYREKYAKDQIIIKYRKSNKIYEIMYTKTDFKNRLDKNIEQIISIHSKEPNLEDIFLKITGKELMKNG
ncbi:MAG: ABC transporter ATP-binding protein, partial [Tissierellia bacterium]|nr:ABC transporter ATP-binding protein [Tissierellia bacterium]